MFKTPMTYAYVQLKSKMEPVHTLVEVIEFQHSRMLGPIVVYKDKTGKTCAAKTAHVKVKAI